MYRNISLTSYSDAESKSIFDLPKLYYTPKTINIFGKTAKVEPSVQEMIEAYFISSDDKVYGYYTGIKGINEIHGTTQVPAQIDIKSNKVNKKRMYELGCTRYVIMPSEIEIGEDNSIYLQLLDMIENYYNAFEEDVVACVKNAVTELKLDKNNIETLSFMYSQRTKEIIKDVFTSK